MSHMIRFVYQDKHPSEYGYSASASFAEKKRTAAEIMKMQDECDELDESEECESVLLESEYSFPDFPSTEVSRFSSSMEEFCKKGEQEKRSSAIKGRILLVGLTVVAITLFWLLVERNNVPKLMTSEIQKEFISAVDYTLRLADYDGMRLRNFAAASKLVVAKESLDEEQKTFVFSGQETALTSILDVCSKTKATCSLEDGGLKMVLPRTSFAAPARGRYAIESVGGVPVSKTGSPLVDSSMELMSSFAAMSSSPGKSNLAERWVSAKTAYLSEMGKGAFVEDSSGSLRVFVRQSSMVEFFSACGQLKLACEKESESVIKVSFSDSSGGWDAIGSLEKH